MTTTNPKEPTMGYPHFTADCDDHNDLVRQFGGPRPEIVVLCGSTRFGAAFRRANFDLTLAGHIVLSIGCDTKSDDDLWSDPVRSAKLKRELDELHKRKIDLADRVLVLDVDGYIGESTRSEIRYADKRGRPVSYLSSGDLGWVSTEDADPRSRMRQAEAEAAVLTALREQMADAISAADPIDSTSEDCLNLADAALSVVRPRLDKAYEDLADVRAGWKRCRDRCRAAERERDAARRVPHEIVEMVGIELADDEIVPYLAGREQKLAEARAEVERWRKLFAPHGIDHMERGVAAYVDRVNAACGGVHPHFGGVMCDDAAHPGREQHHSASMGIYWLSPCPGCSFCPVAEVVEQAPAGQDDQ